MTRGGGSASGGSASGGLHRGWGGGLHPGGLQPGGGGLHRGKRGLHPWGSASGGECWADSPGLPTNDGSPCGGGGQTPSQDTWDTMGYGKQAGGTHPTGMIFCLQIVL